MRHRRVFSNLRTGRRRSRLIEGSDVSTPATAAARAPAYAQRRKRARARATALSARLRFFGQATGEHDGPWRRCDLVRDRRDRRPFSAAGYAGEDVDALVKI